MSWLILLFCFALAAIPAYLNYRERAMVIKDLGRQLDATLALVRSGRAQSSEHVSETDRKV